jgi:serine protease Do
MPREQRRQGLGSGFIISAAGEVLTNNHVVAGADRIRVGLFGNDRTTYNARVLGRDPLTDSALLRLEDPPRLTVAALGDSEALEPGDWVLAIGNPFRLGHTVTVGVVSYKARSFAVTEGRFQNMLQTDASINPGNSGGPLLNTRGEVVGINSAILSGQSGGGNIGIGFAVPINTVKALLPELRQGQVQRGRLGVQVQTPPITQDEARQLGLPKPSGAIVSMVERNSPADRAGLRAGDVIVEFNGTSIDDGEELTATVVGTRGGTRAPVVFYRGGQRQTTTVTVETLSLEEEGRRAQAQPQRVGFGLSLTDITAEIAQQLRLAPGTRGAVVESVEPFAPAANAGLTRGDVVLQINRQPVRSAQDAARLLRQVGAGQSAFVLLSRQGTQVFVTMRAE